MLKSNKNIQLILFFLGCLQLVNAQNWVGMMQDSSKTLEEIKDEFNTQWKNKSVQPGNGWKQFKRWEYIMSSRVDMNGKIKPSSYSKDQLAQYKATHLSIAAASAASSANWKPIGPNSAKGIEGGLGRVQCFAMDPLNTNNYWAGTPNGGLWKSTDAGANWTSKTDLLVSLGVSWILIHPSTPSIMYIATGDPDGGGSQSTGVLKSTDAGETWNATGLAFKINDYKQINKIAFQAGNPSVLFAATSDGLYRSLNAGTDWTLVYNGTRIYDFEFQPNNSSVIYAAGYGKYLKSVNAGLNWTELSNGLPPNSEKTLVAVTANAPNNVYYVNTSANSLEGIYVSDNNGSTFNKLNTSVSIGGQAWWDLVFEVNPLNKDKMYLGGVWMNESNDGGLTWPINYYTIHADDHNMFFYNNDFFICNDGGLYKSVNNGKDWTHLHNGMQISQFYRISAYTYDPAYLLAGSQDNGTFRLKNNAWKQVMGADGMDNAHSKQNPDLFWVSTQNGALYKTNDGGNTFNYTNGNINEPGGWVTPFELNPNNHDSVITGFGNVWISNEGGINWTKISSFDQGAPIDKIVLNWNNPQTIYITKGGALWKTNNGGQSWVDLSTNMVAGTYVSRAVAIDPANSDRIWIAGGTYNTGAKKVFYSSNGGQTFTDIGGTIPDLPYLCMVYVPGSNDALYLGADVGVFYKDNSLSDWEMFTQGLPNVRVEDLQLNMGTGKILAGTYGRGIWESVLHPYTASAKPVADFEPAVKAVCKGSAIAFKDFSFNATSWNWSFPGGTPSVSTQQNPLVTYSNAGTFDVSLTVSNANGSNTKSFQGMVVISGNVINTFPYTENFDHLDTALVENTGDWLNGTDDQRNWTVRKGKSPARVNQYPIAVGPTKDNTTGNGNYLLIESGSDGNKFANLYSPCFNLNNLQNPVFEYYEHIQEISNSGGELHLDVQADGIWKEDLIPSEVMVGDLWIKKTVDLKPFSSKIIRFRFRAKTAWSAKDFALDDIKIYSHPPVAPIPAFVSTLQSGLIGFKTKFFDQSSYLPQNYSWSFPGGTPATSTEANPEVVYNTAGTYNVELTVSNAFGSSTLNKTTYIVAKGMNHIMNNQTVNDCVGRVYDSGGANGNYGDNEKKTFTIVLAGAQQVVLSFYDWNLTDADAVAVFDGNSINAPLIGRYGSMWGNSAPAPVSANSGAVTIRIESDAAGNGGGFRIEWEAIGGTCSPNTTLLPPIADFVAPKTVSRAPFYAYFTDQSSNEPSGWTWLFPGADENRKYGRDAGTVYSQPGNYDVSLIVVNEAGRDTITKKAYIRVIDSPQEVYMQNSTVTACKGILYDDGGSYSNYNPSANETLVIQPLGATSITMNFTEFNLESNADFLKIYNGASIAAPLIGTYSANSPETITATSGAMTLVFVSNSSVEGKGWIANWTAKGGNCIPKAKPEADFSADPLSIYAGNQVYFYDLSSNLPDSIKWEFPGGLPAVSNENTPVVVYDLPGTYTVKLSAYNALGGNTITKTNYITVLPAHIPIAAFGSDNTDIYTGGSVQFYDYSSYNPKSWTWSFEGGSPATSNLKNPIVNYAAPGLYTVKLKVANAGGADSILKEKYIIVKNKPAPAIDFSADNTLVEAGSMVQFKDLSGNDPTSWFWEFEGGTPALSSLQNPLINYSVPGIYPVTLTATNAGGSATLKRKEFITVLAAPVVVNMHNGTEMACTGTLYDDGGPKGNYKNKKTYILTIKPKGATSVSIDFNEWSLEKKFDFMRIFDGASVYAPLIGSWSEKSPGTISSKNGSITLLFKSDASVNAAGWKATWKAKGGECTPKLPPVADFTTNKNTVFAGDDVQFTDLSENEPEKWSWVFDGGEPSTSNEKNPLVNYPNPGTYPVTLVVANPLGSDFKGFKEYIAVIKAENETEIKNGKETACRGILYDDGGAKGNYKNKKNYTYVLEPEGASYVSLNFKEWKLESNYDYLKIYDGKNTSAPLIGSYSDKSPGLILSKTGALTLKFSSDNFVNAAGWKAYWYSDGSWCNKKLARLNTDSNDDRILQTQQNDRIFIYPNPAQTEFTVETEEQYNQLNIYDALGTLVMHQKLTELKTKISLNKHLPGMYFVQLIAENGTTSTIKLVVKD